MLLCPIVYSYSFSSWIQQTQAQVTSYWSILSPALTQEGLQGLSSDPGGQEASWAAEAQGNNSQNWTVRLKQCLRQPGSKPKMKKTKSNQSGYPFSILPTLSSVPAEIFCWVWEKRQNSRYAWKSRMERRGKQRAGTGQTFHEPPLL